MSFHLPKDITKRFHPNKNRMMYLQQGEKVLQRYHWDPLVMATIKDVENFLTEVVGMIRVEPNAQHIESILETLVYEQSDMQYVCSYSFPDTSTRDKYALPEELLMYNGMDMNYETNMKGTNDVFFSGDVKEIWRAELTGNMGVWVNSKYKLLDLYSSDEIHFGNFNAYGVLPIIVEFSLHYLLGKEPIPDVMHSRWSSYLQFLIDIGYVKEI